MKKVLLFMLLITLLSCTQNEIARNYGGSEEIILDKDLRLINVTWKSANIWILTKKDTTKPSVYYFKEKSNYGLQEGTITIIEK